MSDKSPNNMPPTWSPSSDRTNRNAIGCIFLRPTQPAKDIVWSGAITQKVLHNGTYFASNHAAMEIVRAQFSSICYSGHREDVGGSPFLLPVPPQFSLGMTVVFVELHVLPRSVVYTVCRWLFGEQKTEYARMVDPLRHGLDIVVDVTNEQKQTVARERDRALGQFERMELENEAVREAKSTLEKENFALTEITAGKDEDYKAVVSEIRAQIERSLIAPFKAADENTAAAKELDDLKFKLAQTEGALRNVEDNRHLGGYWRTGELSRGPE
jgi:hypothetical protein